ncbi:hypothetical protein NKR19_g2969 [Coniochaeta hoffmannii]|uniref:Uncharacterized protein n=1 Tax=Coniochaeta hoffmannii TaxID=91930 RepID=A0AA38SHS1_9PEZI|nr:hypothetical protein NKR19_g2969 [Coniochaeta hoffmannii]
MSYDHNGYPLPGTEGYMDPGDEGYMDPGDVPFDEYVNYEQYDESDFAATQQYPSEANAYPAQAESGSGFSS